MQIIQRFIPKGHSNRPGYYMDPKYITIHNTANTDPSADAELHSRYIDNPSTDDSWHFTVDDHSIYQHLPLNENGWHAGDGSHGTGNRQSIGIELCENEGNDFNKTIKNAIWLVRKLMKDHNIPLENVVPHKHWSGKNCPHLLLGMWGAFINQIKEDPKMKLNQNQKEIIEDLRKLRITDGEKPEKTVTQMYLWEVIHGLVKAIKEDRI